MELHLTPIAITLLVFWVWMLVTTIFALYPESAWNQWNKVWKIMLTTFMAIMLVNTKERVLALTVVCTLSIGFFGFKGGWFTLMTGGQHRVWGPAGSFIGGNNEVGLALIMTIPLLFFLRSLVVERWLRYLLLFGIGLCVFAILGTHSRGALVGIAAMGGFLALKSKNKMQYILLVLLLAPIAYQFMPDVWHDRMETITDYQTDASAQGRIMAWRMAFNMALSELTGGGFSSFRPASYLMYLPEVGARKTDAHSIYFEILGEHGFVGLGLFLVLGILGLKTCGRIARLAKGTGEFWMESLARMMQVALVGYAAAGAFLGLAYFNYYYALLAIVVGMSIVAKKDQEAAAVGRIAPTGVALKSEHSAIVRSGDVQGLGKWKLRNLWAAAKVWYARL